MAQQIVSLSGGKDSTAMLHMMLDRGEKIDAVIFFDTGWEFPAMMDHIDLVEKKSGVEIVRLKPEKPFAHWLVDQPVKSKKDRPDINIKTGEVYRIGNGWPSPTRRWCTRQKVSAINKYVKANFDNPVMCVGFAADETHRDKNNSKYVKRYPLIEWGVTEADALAYCNELGYLWDSLYEYFPRVSCFCCPLQGLDELRKIRKHFSDLWQQMLHMDASIQSNRGFAKYDTVADLDRRFEFEDRLAELNVPPKLRKQWSTKFKEII